MAGAGPGGHTSLPGRPGARPALTRTLLVEVHAVGPRALALRRAVLRRFAGLLRELVESGRRDQPRLPELTPAMSTALVGGINELVLSTLEEDGADRLDQLEETIVRFVAVGPPP